MGDSPKRLRIWDFIVFTAIAIALVVAGEGLYHAPGNDIQVFNNHTFDDAAVFIVLLLLVYAIFKNLHFLRSLLLSRQTWLAILLTFASLETCIEVYRLTRFDPTWIMIAGTGLWAAIDSQKIQLSRYKSGISYPPVVIFIGFLLIWIIAFPWYLIVRHKIKIGTAALKDEGTTET